MFIQQRMLALFAALLLAPLAALSAADLAATTPPHADCRPGDGIYMSTYGGNRQRAYRETIDSVLELPYVAGVVHYMLWRELEPTNGVYDWRQLDDAFAEAKRHHKRFAFGLIAGMDAPAWVMDSVKTVDFVNANPLIQRGQRTVRMPVPWDERYFSLIGRTLRKMAERYDGDPAVSFVNTWGPSAYGGVEANFFINLKKSIEMNPGFEKMLDFTLDKYVSYWKRAIDLHLEVFTKSRLCFATHNWIYGGPYSAEQQGRAAREIRDYALRRYAEVRGSGSRMVIRNCGLSPNMKIYGNPDTGEGIPATDYAALLWEVRAQADIGFETAGVARRLKYTPEDFGCMLRIAGAYQGYIVEIRVSDLWDSEKNAPYAPYVPALRKAAQAMGPVTTTSAQASSK